MTGQLPTGVWGVVATPFLGSDLSVDEASLTRLVTHYQDLGVTGLTVLGVLGEAAALSTQERQAVLEVVSESVTLPLVVGATSLSTAPLIEEARLITEAVGSRLAGVMVQVNSSDPRSLSSHLRAVHEATGANLVAQDYPLASGVTIRVDDLVRAVRDAPGVVAVKAESAPTTQAIASLVADTRVPVFGGLGGVGLLDELAAGAAGAMTGFSHPEGLLACVQAWESGGHRAARAAYLPYLPLAVFEFQPGIGLAVRKEVLRRRGLILDSAVRPPSRPMPEGLARQLDLHLTELARGRAA